MKKIIVLLIILLTGVLCGTYVSAEEFDFSSVKQKYFEFYMEENNPSDEWAYINYTSMNEDGSYSDIVYDGDLSVAWTHLRNLVNIVSSANKSGTKLNDVKVDAMAKIEKGIRYWYDTIGVPLDDNGIFKGNLLSSWWNYTIGQQLHILPLLVLTDGNISKESQDILLSYLYDSEDMKNYPEFLTATNLLWYENQGMIEAIVTEDFDKLKKSFNIITSDINIRQKPYIEGIQVDGSFHQHGPNFYPSYGDNYLLHISTHLRMMHGTSLERIDLYPVISRTILDGFRWIMLGTYTNPNLYGRQISDKVTGPPDNATKIRYIRSMAEIDSANAEELTAFADYLESGNDSNPPVIGNKYFYRSDMLVNNRDGYSFNFRMVSDRTVSSECNGVQNLYGSYMGFGTSFLEKPGDNHYGYSVYMDWTRLPGTTTPDTVDKITYSGTLISQREKFVGGVSDGEYGAAAMKMSAFRTKAKKSCFAFDDEIVFLGADITSARSGVRTSVEQRFKYGSVTVNGEEIYDGEKLFNDVSYITENNISYIFPDKPDVYVKTGMLTGKWSDIGSSTDTNEYSANCFAVWIPHGDMPVDKKYSYIILPECSEEQAADYSGNIPVDIISNTDKLQAVYHKNLGIGYAVFYEAGECRFNDTYTVSVSKPCILMMRKNSGGVDISISNPEQIAEKIDVTLYTNDNLVKKTYTMSGTSFTEGTMGGSTITESF